MMHRSSHTAFPAPQPGFAADVNELALAVTARSIKQDLELLVVTCIHANLVQSQPFYEHGAIWWSGSRYARQLKSETLGP